MEERYVHYCVVRSNSTSKHFFSFLFFFVFFSCQVIDRFLPCVGALLSPLGVLYLLVLAQNKPGIIILL